MRKRIIPCLFLKNGLIIRSESFSVHQIIGNPVTELKRFSEWAVDEIIYIDLSTSPVYDLRRDEHKVKLPKDKFELLSEIAKSCFVPLGFGGGVRTLRDIEKILHCGADKVVLNTVLLEKPALLIEAAHIFGSQALVACVDYRGGTVFHSHGTVNSGIRILDWCARLEEQGIGEIIIHAIERDGVAEGFDCEVVKNVVGAVNVPVIALGGAGDYSDFLECFTVADPSAVAAGNIFHFREHSDYHIKNLLASAGINIRNAWRGEEKA